MTKSLNIGLKSANGDFIARMDADDISLKNRFQIQLNYLLDNPEIGMVSSSYEEINESGQVIRKNIPFETEPPIIHWRLFFENPIPHPPIMIRRDLINRVGGYDEKIKFAQDYDLFCRLSLITKLCNLPNVLLKYRVHTKSISKKSNIEQRYLAFRISRLHIFKYIDIAVSDYEMNLLWNRDFKNSKDRNRYVELLYKFHLAVLNQRKWSKKETIKFKKYVVLKLYYHLASMKKNQFLLLQLIKVFLISPTYF